MLGRKIRFERDKVTPERAALEALIAAVMRHSSGPELGEAARVAREALR
jgi:hypothetical protein